MPACHFCGAQLEERKPSRNDVCPKCGRDVKICLNCTFHDPGSHNKCREPEAEWVKEKDRSNFCDFFRFSSGRGKVGVSREDSARKKLDQLFGKKDV